MKSRKRKADDPLCPVCNQRVPDIEIQAHVELCLKRSEGRTNGNGTDDDDDSDSVDVEAESFEEYEWAGQVRVRAASLLEGGYQAAGIGTTIITNKSNNGDDDEDDEDLNVDVDDTQVFGAAQYTERDVILPLISNNNKKETEQLLYLRNLATGAATTSDGEMMRVDHDCMMDEQDVTALMSDCDEMKASSSWMNVGDQTLAVDFSAANQCAVAAAADHLSQTPVASSSAITNGAGGDGGQKQIIESLKKKIREYELQIRNKSKCLICIDEFRIPVVSICCWHVHCEECWLRTLGARKLCPQCNMITSPSDLRRIYMWLMVNGVCTVLLAVRFEEQIILFL